MESKEMKESFKHNANMPSRRAGRSKSDVKIPRYLVREEIQIKDSLLVVSLM
jgi:hypothetical protein